MNFKPQRDHFLVEAVAVQQTKSGLQLVKGEMRKDDGVPTLVFGRVIEPAPGFVNENGVMISTRIKAGDVVAFSPSAMQPASDNTSKKLAFVKLNAIIAVVEGFSETIDVLGGE